MYEFSHQESQSQDQAVDHFAAFCLWWLNTVLLKITSVGIYHDVVIPAIWGCCRMRTEFPSHARDSGLPLGLKLGFSYQQSSPYMKYIKTTQWVSRDLVRPVAAWQVGEEKRFQCDVGKLCQERFLNTDMGCEGIGVIVGLSKQREASTLHPLQLCSLNCELGEFSWSLLLPSILVLVPEIFCVVEWTAQPLGLHRIGFKS